MSEQEPRLDGEQLAGLLRALGEADGVELKLTVPETAHRSTLAALDVDPLDAQVRQVVFLDTPDLALDRAGLVVRARRIQRHEGDTVVKARPVDPAALPDDVRRAPGFTVEVDAMPGRYVCSASLRHTVTNEDVRAATSGVRPRRTIFSPAQRAFYARRAPAGVGLDDLSVLGPVFVLKLKLPRRALGRKVVVELWLQPTGTRILELSTKCAPSEATEVAQDLRTQLEGRGVVVSGEQRTKTRSTLELFSAELTDDAPASWGPE